MAHSRDTLDVSGVLRELMAERELSGRSLAQRAEISRVTFSRRLSGNGMAFRLDEFCRVTDVLGVVPDEVFRVARESATNTGGEQ